MQVGDTRRPEPRSGEPSVERHGRRAVQMKASLEACQSYPVYRLAGADVVTSRREVLVEGVARRVEPKVFDLLVCLIENRSRVVSRSELLATAWQGLVVSGSVVARAVMKARTAIDDTDNNRPLIRTVHKVGYQFIGSCVKVHEVSESSLQSPADARKVILLPCGSNLNPQNFGWVPLGLMLKLSKMLSEHPRLQLVSADALVREVGNLSQELLPTYGRELLRVFDADHAVYVAISHVAGSFRAEAMIFDRHQSRVLNAMTADTVFALLSSLDRLLAATLLDPSINAPLAAPSGDAIGTNSR